MNLAKAYIQLLTTGRYAIFKPNGARLDDVSYATKAEARTALKEKRAGILVD